MMRFGRSQPEQEPSRSIAPDRETDAINGEYGTAISFGLPGWGMLSVLGAVPGLSLPLLITALSDLDMPFPTILIAAAVVPLSALLGLGFGLVGIKRAKTTTLARLGAVLNAAVLVSCVAIIAIAIAWRS